jgi:hypothetical protein
MTSLCGCPQLFSKPTEITAKAGCTALTKRSVRKGVAVMGGLEHIGVPDFVFVRHAALDRTFHVAGQQEDMAAVPHAQDERVVRLRERNPETAPAHRSQRRRGQSGWAQRVGQSSACSPPHWRAGHPS